MRIFYNICALINPFNPLLVKKIVKALFSGILLFMLGLSSKAQLKPITADDFGPDIKKVIREYPHQFSKLTGEVIDEKPQSTDYECTFKVKGAEESIITKYSAKNKSIYSWQALMLTTDDFEEAKKKFRSLYTRLNHLAVKMDYGVTFYLTGKYIEPLEEKNFTSAILSFELPDQITKKMKLEVSMQYELMEWKVRVLIYERDKEDQERGEITE
jgi:hypothetical protein